MQNTKLEVKNLQISFSHEGNQVNAVRDVSFSLGQEKLAIVGESGSGKSTVGRSLLKLHPKNATVEAEKLLFGDIDLLKASEKNMRDIRGRRISMIMQDPKYSLNPVMKVGDQIAEAYLAHYKVSKKIAQEKALVMLEKVQIRDPKRVYSLYPHEVSGGMGQRVMIAMMLIPEPEIIIADEPTSALDVSVQRQVLNLLDELINESNIGLIFISHDLDLVRNYCDRVLVMYAGRVVESIKASELENAHHPYTQGLLKAPPRIGDIRHRLPTLERDPSWLYN